MSYKVGSLYDKWLSYFSSATVAVWQKWFIIDCWSYIWLICGRERRTESWLLFICLCLRSPSPLVSSVGVATPACWGHWRPNRVRPEVGPDQSGEERSHGQSTASPVWLSNSNHRTSPLLAGRNNSYKFYNKNKIKSLEEGGEGRGGNKEYKIILISSYLFPVCCLRLQTAQHWQYRYHFSHFIQIFRESGLCHVIPVSDSDWGRVSHHAAALPGCPSFHPTAGPSPASAPPPLLQEVAGAALRREQLHSETAGNGSLEWTVDCCLLNCWSNCDYWAFISNYGVKSSMNRIPCRSLSFS